jgi:hypothetical protein
LRLREPFTITAARGTAHYSHSHGGHGPLCVCFQCFFFAHCCIA